LLLWREIKTEACLGALEPPMNIAMAYRLVSPLVDIDIRLFEVGIG